MNLLAGLDARVKLLCLTAFIVATLHVRSFWGLAICLAVVLALAVVVRLSGRDVRAIMVPLAPILAITVIMQVLYFQQGSVVVQLGPIALTHEAIAASTRMIASLFTIMIASVSFMRCTSSEELVRALRWLLSPLRVFGLRVEAFMFSLIVAFRFAPVLVEEFRRVKRAQEARCGSFDGGVLDRLKAYMRLFAPLVRSSFRRADNLAEASVSRCLACGAKPVSMHVGNIGTCDAICVVFTFTLLGVLLLV